MRTARSACRAGLRVAAGLAALAVTTFIAPLPARAASVFVEVNPSTIQAGFQVAIRASCGDALNDAKVKSDAFGEVTVKPLNSYLIAAATVPEHTKPRQYNVRLTCESNKQSATTTLWVIGQDTPTKGPATGGGALADNGTMMISGGAAAIGLGTVLLVAHYRRRVSV